MSINYLQNIYTEIINELDQTNTSNNLEAKVNRLSAYIFNNSSSLITDLSQNTPHGKVYSDIKTALAGKTDSNVHILLKRLNSIEQSSKMINLTSNMELLVNFINTNQKEVVVSVHDFANNPEKILKAFKGLKPDPEVFQEDFESTLSLMVVHSLGLNDIKKISNLTLDDDTRAFALASFVNTNKIPLKQLNLPIDALNKIASYLQYVDCRDLSFKDSGEAENFIKKCSHATSILINSDKIKELKNLPVTLKMLNCAECTSLKKLEASYLPNLQKLVFSKCTSLTELNITHVPRIETLWGPNCNSLTQLSISFLPNLKQFCCNDCKSLVFLTVSNLPNLEELSCNGCTSLKTLTASELPKLKKLYFYDCSDLNTLTTSDLPSLQILYCYRCTSLNSLNVSRMPSLEEVNCTLCTSLNTLNVSQLLKLKKMICTHCKSLVSIEASNLPLLKELECQYCTLLTRLHANNLPNLEEFKCNGCSLLETIISDGFPRCRRFEHEECQNLRQLPQLAPGVEVFSHNSIAFNHFEVDPEELENQPINVLLHLGEAVLKDKRMPNIIFLRSEGIDAGGLRRQLVTSLLKNLLQKPNSPLKLSKPEESLEEGIFPLLETYEEQSANVYKALGALIALASLGVLPLGKVLRTEFYYVLLNLLPEIDSINPNEPLPETLKRKIYNLITIGYPTDETPDEEIPPFCLPIIMAAKGFKEIVRESDLNALQNPEKFNSFVTKVLGEDITLENFQRLSEYKGDEGHRVKGYFEQFFEKYKKDPKMLGDIVELFTSSRALGPEKIKITVDGKMSKDALPTIATCFQQVVLPPYESYELFEEKLLKTLEHTAGQFGKH